MPDLPIARDVLASITSERMDQVERNQRDHERHVSDRGNQAAVDYANLVGLRNHYKLKQQWSWFLMAVVALLLWFQSYLLYKVGVGCWDFTDYTWLLPALLVQNLTQIIALAIIIVRSLYAKTL